MPRLPRAPTPSNRTPPHAPQLTPADPSDPRDPLPLSEPTASRILNPLLPGGALRAEPAGRVTMLFLKITVSRNW